MADVIVVTAPDEFQKKFGVKVFLAGGITNCPNWQKDVIECVKKHFNLYCNEDLYVNEKYGNHADLVIFNPRRENFPIHDPSAAKEQIEWEFNALEKCDVFSMYFSSGESDQPICMYELGRNICRMQDKSIYWKSRIVVTVENGYRRKDDVIIQSRLAADLDIPVFSDEIGYEGYILSHATRILEAYQDYLDWRYSTPLSSSSQNYLHW